ncbi:MAG TPA: hypothetical protein PK544_14185 [Spirochaetota bacterium]|nr:hypothetical protein [Spirochaetota bacterium]HPJ38917.1 hypothetical protein [Spirochaetota bacterium]HPQ54721.1 hypothetical protein [Spirochaetota bacterium]
MKINDTKLYLFFSIITLVFAVIIGSITYYSKLIVEPRAERLIAAEGNVSENYRIAYSILRKPQMFADYENFDRESVWIKNVIIPYMDDKAYHSRSYTPDEKVYLEALIKRRKQGSDLGRNTMVFFLILTILGMGFYLYELKKVKAQG